jgi:hypothetical protein
MTSKARSVFRDALVAYLQGVTPLGDVSESQVSGELADAETLLIARNNVLVGILFLCWLIFLHPILFLEFYHLV